MLRGETLLPAPKVTVSIGYKHKLCYRLNTKSLDNAILEL